MKDRLLHSLASALLFAGLLPAPSNAEDVRGAALDAAGPRWVLPDVTAPRVQRVLFESAAVKAKVSCFVYTPESYDAEPERRFPVLYWLHGTGGGLPGIAPVSAFFDQAIRAGKIPPMLVVFPNGLVSSMWCDSQDGRVPMETIVIKELIPRIDATFRTQAARESRIIEGFSMGGYGAARLGFKHPASFAAVSILAGGPFDPEFRGPRATSNPKEREAILQTTFGGDIECFKAQSPWVIAQQNAANVRDKTRVRIAVGSKDFTADLNRKFAAHLAEIGIPHHFTELPEVAHSALQLLNALGEANWEFYRQAFTPSDLVKPSTKP